MFEFIQRYVLEHRRSPLIREIQDGCEIASYKSAIDRLNALERKGYIKRVPNKHRAIRVVRRLANAQPAKSEEQTKPVKASSVEASTVQGAV